MQKERDIVVIAILVLAVLVGVFQTQITAQVTYEEQMTVEVLPAEEVVVDARHPQMIGVRLENVNSENQPSKIIFTLNGEEYIREYTEGKSEYYLGAVPTKMWITEGVAMGTHLDPGIYAIKIEVQLQNGESFEEEQFITVGEFTTKSVDEQEERSWAETVYNFITGNAVAENDKHKIHPVIITYTDKNGKVSDLKQKIKKFILEHLDTVVEKIKKANPTLEFCGLTDKTTTITIPPPQKKQGESVEENIVNDLIKSGVVKPLDQSLGIWYIVIIDRSSNKEARAQTLTISIGGVTYGVTFAGKDILDVTPGSLPAIDLMHEFIHYITPDTDVGTHDDQAPEETADHVPVTEEYDEYLMLGQSKPVTIRGTNKLHEKSVIVGPKLTPAQTEALNEYLKKVPETIEGAPSSCQAPPVTNEGGQSSSTQGSTTTGPKTSGGPKPSGKTDLKCGANGSNPTVDEPGESNDGDSVSNFQGSNDLNYACTTTDCPEDQTCNTESCKCTPNETEGPKTGTQGAEDAEKGNGDAE